MMKWIKSSSLLAFLGVVSLLGFSEVSAEDTVNIANTVNITVPSSINIVMNEDGSNTISDFYIQNDMPSSLTLDSIGVSSVNGWSIVPSDSNIATDSKQLSLSVGGTELLEGVNTVSIEALKGTRTNVNIGITRGAFSKNISNIKAFDLSMSYTLNIETANYKVNHYLMGLDGSSYILKETEILEDKLGYNLETSKLKKDYEGFTYENSLVGGNLVSNTTINEDGSTVVDLYYSRNKYEVTLNVPNGIGVLDFYVNEEPVLTKGKTYTGSHYYGSTWSIKQIQTYVGIKYDGAYSGVIGAENTTIPVSFSVADYSIGYDLAGGTVSGINPTSYTKYTESFSLVNPTKLGVTFKGWVEVLKPSMWYEGDISVQDGDIYESTRGAWYSEKISGKAGITYTLTPHPSGVSIGARFYDSRGKFVKYVKADSSYTPRVDGHFRIVIAECRDIDKETFHGLTSSLQSSVTITKGKDSGNRYYIASYESKDYTVSFNATTNGGNISTANKIVTGGDTYGTLPTPDKRTGYTFTGWFTSTSGGTKITEDSIVNLSGNITLYAQWSKNTLTVLYNANGGYYKSLNTNYTVGPKGYILGKDGVRLQHRYTYGSSLVSSGLADYNSEVYVNIDKVGFSAIPDIEWNTKPDGSGKSFSQSTVYKVSDIADISNGSKSITLYVNWVEGDSILTLANDISSIKTLGGIDSVTSMVFDSTPIKEENISTDYVELQDSLETEGKIFAYINNNILHISPSTDNKISLSADSSNLFTPLTEYTNISTIDLSNVDTTRVVDSSYMFGKNTGRFKEVVCEWDLESLKTAEGMFYGVSGSVGIAQIGGTANVSSIFCEGFGSGTVILNSADIVINLDDLGLYWSAENVTLGYIDDDTKAVAEEIAKSSKGVKLSSYYYKP